MKLSEAVWPLCAERGGKRAEVGLGMRVGMGGTGRAAQKQDLAKEPNKTEEKLFA